MNAHAKFLPRERGIRWLSLTGSLFLHTLLIYGMAFLGARSVGRGLAVTSPGPMILAIAVSRKDESLRFQESPVPLALDGVDRAGELGSGGEIASLELKLPDPAESLDHLSPPGPPVPSPLGPQMSPRTVEGRTGQSPQLGLHGGSQQAGRAGQGVGDGSSVRTQVFGIEAEGSRFVYVFDRSGSMVSHHGRPLAQAKAELLRSLEDLQSVHQFQIIFYNEKPQLFNPRGGIPSLLWADAANKQHAQEFVLDIQAAGGTQHLDALRMALKMGPDVIFFLTDADEPRMSRAHLDEVQRANHGAQVHTIEFGDGQQTSGRNFLMELAEENGGQHVYVDMVRSAFLRP